MKKVYNQLSPPSTASRERSRNFRKKEMENYLEKSVQIILTRNKLL